MNRIEDLVLIYRADNGDIFEQMASDLTDVGTLIDPDTGEDLELIDWRTI